MLYDVAVVHYGYIRVRVLRDLLVIYISTAYSISIACLVFGDQHHPILSGDPVVAAFDRQNVLEI